MKISEDNNGFVNFPIGFGIKQNEGKTLIYLITFDGDKNYILNNLNIKLSGEKIIDDISGDCNLINDSLYFSEDDDKYKSISLTSAICIGWNEKTFMVNNRDWFATFRDLSSEGRKLYYTIKKLHNNKEIRILTITGIK